MISTQALSELLEVLYSAPLDETQWQIFLTRLCEITQSNLGFFLRNDSALGNRTLASGGVPVPARVEQGFRAAHNYSDPFRRALLRNPRIGVIEGEEFFPHDEFVNTKLYRDLAESGGMEYATCLVLSVSTRTFEVLSLWRGPGRAVLEAEHKELLALLMPHLKNALRIRHALGLAEGRARNAEAMLNLSVTASFLLNADGRVVHSNEAAQEMVASGDGLVLRDELLLPADRGQRAEFAALIADCVASDLRHSGGALAVRRRSQRRPLQLLVTPCRVADKRRDSVRALALATDPECTIDYPDAVLRSTFGLTPAETEVANALLTGFSVEEIAQLRNVSTTTVRSQLKALMAKTETERQSDLVRLLSTVPRAVPQKKEIHSRPSFV